MGKFKRLMASAIATVMTLTVCAMPVHADSVSWNFKNSSFKNLGTISSTTTVDNLTLVATSAKTMSVIADSQTLSGTTYTYCLSTGGGGSTSYRSVKVPVTKNGTNVIKVTMRSTGSSSRTLVVSNPTGGQLSTMTAGTSISTQTYTYTGKNSNIYLFSNNSNINIYKIQVDSSSSSSSDSSDSSSSSSSGSSSSSSSNALYVSTSGSDSNSGTSSSPYLTIAKAVSKASSGTTIYVASGTYYETSTLKLSKSINIVASGSRPTINFSKMSTSDSNRGIQISGSNCTIDNIKITNAGDNGIYISGSNNTIQNCYITKCQDTGIQLSNGAADNYIYNCTSTYNYDDKTSGENADGFAAKLSIGSGNVFKKCTAEYNSDDGWDFYYACNPVKVYVCEANYSGVDEGNGNGFKVGGNYSEDKHYLEGCSATGNKLRGFDQNNNMGAVTLKNCTGTSNYVNFYFSKAPNSGSHSFTNCVSKNGSSKDKIVGATTSGCTFNT